MAEDHWARDAPRLCRPTCSNSMSIGLSHLLGMSQVMHSTSLRLKTLLTTVSWGETTSIGLRLVQNQTRQSSKWHHASRCMCPA